MKRSIDRTKREKALKILERLKKDYPQFDISKTRGSDAIYVTLPRERVKTPVSAGHEKDSTKLELIVDLAQRMATAMVRETMNTLVDKVVSKLADGLVDELVAKLPAQQTVIRKVASEASHKIKQKFITENPDLYVPASFDSGLELVGSAGSQSKKSDASDIDSILAALEGKT